MKVLVCAKRVVDPNVQVRVAADGRGIEAAGLKLSLNPFDEIAVEEAVRMKEAGRAAEVVALSIGPASCRDVLRTAMAIGADRGILVEHDGELDSLGVARLIAAVVSREQPDLVLMGKQGTDQDYGQTTAMLAGLLDWPQAAAASAIVVGDRQLEVTCEADRGTERLAVSLPAVVSADLRLNTPRYASLPAVMKAKKKQIDTFSVSELGGAPAPRTAVLGVVVPPARAAGRLVASPDELAQALRTALQAA